MEVILEGKKVLVDIIGGFNFEEKDYAVCSYEDEDNNNMIVVLLTETVGDKLMIKEIPDDDIEKVTNCFNKIKNSFLEEE